MPDIGFEGRDRTQDTDEQTAHARVGIDAGLVQASECHPLRGQLLGDLHQIIERLMAKGVEFRCLAQAGVNTDTSTGRLMMGIVSAVAAFESDLRRERQMEGVEKAKAAGKYKGRPASIDPTKVRELHASGMGASQIAKTMKIGRASVYRALAA